MTEAASLRAEYEALRERASESLKLRDLRAALEVFDRALDVARRLGERDLEDVAYCNRSAVAIRLGIDDDSLRSLRQMLMRTSDSRIAYLSAYNLCQACDNHKDYRKALFYARIASRYALELGEAEQQAAATNQIGNALVALNDFAGGLKEYEQAESLVADTESERRSLILSNLGYCYFLTGATHEGFRAVFLALRMARRLRAPVAEAAAHLCLSFAYLLAERPWYALRHGSESLEIAEILNDEESMKYALLLLGEAYKQGGKVVAARECFELLQRTYYPGMGEVPEMLLGVDICRVINLRG
jgi:tetratricopeptide (TPR) repeat protein